MSTDIVTRNSAWDMPGIERFLTDARVPMRIGCTGNEYPVVCSIWFRWHDGAIWSAVHESAYLLKQIRRQARVAFDISTNEFPYRGVRGKADVEIVQTAGGDTLEQLIQRYLGDSNPELAQWLLSRSKDEYALRLVPNRITAWDYSDRMQPDA